MSHIQYIPLSEIRRIRQSVKDPSMLSRVLATIFRINTLYMIAKAGSGHIGSSFSAMDIVTWLWSGHMNNPNEPKGDVYFSSKGHDAPGLYAVMTGFEKIDFDSIHTLRRLHGLPGHPDVHTPSIPANTGSLGMGIAKARGMATARRLDGAPGRFYVLTGDGELQEGQIWESLQPTANRHFSEITVIVDHNKLQSDTLVERVSPLGDLDAKFSAFGWAVYRIDGHDISALQTALDAAMTVTDRPQAIIADTIKGKGVSFMEKLPDDDLYKYHSGAPSEDEYAAALVELHSALLESCKQAGCDPIEYESVETGSKSILQNPEKLIAAYTEELISQAEKNDAIVAMDADLIKDTGLAEFKKQFPDRYVECGIAEQDMVSFAGGLAREGKLPIVHSFECFLSTRPNEQIFNNATERTKIIYTGSLAGVLPAGPGHSHQSVRGISTLGSIPGITMIEPANETETKAALRWAVEENDASTYLRLVSIPMELPYALPTNHSLKLGRGTMLVQGTDAVIVAYGPTMLTQAFFAAAKLKEKNIAVAVIDLPWLNTVDDAWLKETLGAFNVVLTLDDHMLRFGQGDMIAAGLARSGGAPKIISLGLTDIPECGRNDEVLGVHRLDVNSIAAALAEAV